MLRGALVLFLGLPAAPGWAAEPPAPVAEVRRVEPDGMRLPWHTTDLFWRLQHGTNEVQRLSATFTVHQDVPDTVNLYISPMGGQHLGPHMFYGGIQTHINGWASPTNQTRVTRGQGVIFSRWGKGPVDIAFARPEPDGLCESAGYEGHFASVRRPIAWKAGTYTWEIRREAVEQVDGKPHTWFACFLLDHTRDTEHRVGALRFEGERFAYNGRSSSFVELYGTRWIREPMVPEVQVTFQPPRINGEVIPAVWVSAYHPRKGARGSPGPPLGRAEVVEGGVRVHLFNRPLEGDAIPPSKYVLPW